MEFWGTFIMASGLFIGAMYFVLKLFALASKTTVTNILGFDEHDSDQFLSLMIFGMVLIFIFMGYFVKGRAYGAEPVPDPANLGTSQMHEDAPASLTPTEIDKDSLKRAKQLKPELHKTHQQRDEEINDYVQKAIDRANARSK